MGVTTEKTPKKEGVKVKLDTKNPFNKGVSYEAFLKNVTKTVTNSTKHCNTYKTL